MNHHEPTGPAIEDVQLSRRGVLRAGGLTLGLATLLAACVEETTDAKPARVGDAPAPEPLPDPVFSDGVLFRTATSLHYSIINAHNVSKELGGLSPEQTAIIDDFIAGHQDAIATLDELTEEAGSEPWGCANPRFDRVIVNVLRDRITGRPRQGTEEADVPESDDPTRDALGMAFAMESVGAATHQSFVPQFSTPQYRSASMTVGVACARRAAALALTINPDNRVAETLLANANLGDSNVPTTVVETTTTVQNIAQNEDAATGSAGGESAQAITAPQVYYAVPSQFGILSAFQFAVGAPSSGNQFTLNIETPSINSFVYDYQTDC